MSAASLDSTGEPSPRPVYVFDEDALLHLYGNAGRTAFASTFNPEHADVAIHQLSVLRLAMHSHPELHMQRGADPAGAARRVLAANVLCGVLARGVDYPLPGVVFRRIPITRDDIRRVTRDRLHRLGQHHVRWNYETVPPRPEPDELEHLIRIGVESLAQRRPVTVVTLHPDRVQWCHAARLEVDQTFFTARANLLPSMPPTKDPS